MAPKGSPRDTDKWRETLRDPSITFPGESSECRRARNQLLDAEDEPQRPVLNGFSRDEDGIYHRWASELTFVRGDNSPLDAIWPIWGFLDLTPNGRGETAAYPSLQYE